MKNAHFKVDTRLASLLGENYRSTEYAIKELVDNCWDADAENVWIHLPEPLTTDSIIIRDDGFGMTENEIRNEYLFIANSRISRKGEITPFKKRKVKGRKGIGKFAGLVVANNMLINSKARGVLTILSIDKNNLLTSRQDLEKVELPVTVKSCVENEKGTEIILSNLNQNLSFPDPEKLKQILIIEYGHQNDFCIYVNDKKIDVKDIPGETIEGTKNLPGVGQIKYKFTVTDGKKPLKHPGLAIRVKDKIIGRPNFLGLEEDDEIPKKLLKKVYGEIESDGLKDDVTADWGAIFENSKGFEEIKKFITPQIKDVIESNYQREMQLAKARLQRKINIELQKLPANKRVFAKRALDRILRKFYNESEDKIDTIISVVLDTLERDEYYEVLQHIDESKHGAIEIFAEALSNFGIYELSMISIQATNRIKFLDYLDTLISRPKTLEKDIHKAIENNVWLFGLEYSLMASNKTLKKIAEKYLDQKFKRRKDKRPDLLLCQDITRTYLLVEFKRPNHTIQRRDENQAEEYRDDLNKMFSENKIEIIVIGGNVDAAIDSKYVRDDIKLLSFASVISNSRKQLDWLLEELRRN